MTAGSASLPPAHASEASPSRASQSTTGLRRYHLDVVALVLALTAFAWACWETRGTLLLVTGDDTTYLALSEAVEQGTYREMFRPSAPPHAKYPPGYPAWLVVARAAVGDRTDLLPIANIVLVASTFLVLFAVVRGIWGAELALAVVVSLALVRGTLWMGGSNYSEALFVLLIVSTLAATWRADRGERWGAYAAIVLAAAAFLTRSAGIAIVVSVGAWLLLGRRNMRELVVFAVVMAAAIGGWFAYVAAAESAAEGVRSYAFDLGPNPYAVTAPISRWAQWWGTVHEYVLYSIPSQLNLRPPQLRTLQAVPGLVLLYAGVPFGVWTLWLRWRAAALFLLAYCPLLIVFPYRDVRLVLPALPLLLVASLLGIWALTERLSATPRRVVRLLLPAVLLLTSSQHIVRQIEDRRGCDRAKAQDDPDCYGPIARDVIQAARHIVGHTPQTEYVLTWHAASLHLLTDRRVESALVVSNAPPDSLAAFLASRSIGGVLLTPVRGFERRELAELLSKSCRDFVLDLALPNGSLLLRRAALVPAGAIRSDACQSLAIFRDRFPWRGAGSPAQPAGS